MLTVLACVRTPDAARAIAVYADRLGVSARADGDTAVEAMARLAERALTCLCGRPLTRPDPVGFVRRAMTRAPKRPVLCTGRSRGSWPARSARVPVA